MTYYDEMNAAINEVERIIKAKGELGVKIPSLEYEILKVYKVSPKHIQRQLNRLEALGLVVVEGEVAFWIGGKNGKTD